MSAQPAPSTTFQYVHPSPALCVRLGRTPDEPSLTVTGTSDTTPQQQSYDSRCTLCWLQQPHSEAAHTQRCAR